MLIWLKQTNNEAVFETQFQSPSTRHGFQVVSLGQARIAAAMLPSPSARKRMWEQSPEALLQSPGLLPLAVLCKTDNATGLLSQVAAEVAKIELPEEREEITGSTQLLAGLRFNADLIRNMFRGGFMRESVVFQEIFQEGRVEGRVEGRQEGKQEGELAIIYRLLSRRLGTVAPELQQRLLRLSIPLLEDLSEALLDFEEPGDLIAWLDRAESDRIENQKEAILATIYRQLPRRIGTLAPELQQRLLELSVPQLEDLTEALLDFEQPNDLIAWLDRLQDS